MAYYAALTTLVNFVEDILLHVRYPNFLLGKNPVMESLHKNLALLQESLEGYSSKGDEANDHVEGRIRDVAHRAQDAIELEIFGQDSAQERSSEKCVQELEMVNHEISYVLEEMRIVKERQTDEDSKQGSNSSTMSGTKRGLTSTNSVHVVGFDDDLITIKDQLCGHSSQLQVIPIVGMGGIGKTTLARRTYDDLLVVDRFDRRAWVVASLDFHMNQFLHTIAKSLGMMTNELHKHDVIVLKERIYKHLKGRRYLVVIDDIWSTQVWDDVKQIFPNDNNGSRIMLTTRLSDVAEYASRSGFLHKVQFLNDDQSWNLLQEKVFGQNHCPSELNDTGKLIAKYCCGLPLAVVVIAGVLSTTNLLHEWKKIAARVREVLSETDEQLSKILLLSYNHLSHQLKACFLYMGSFPEDHQIDISNLVKLWVAEGFLKSTNRSEMHEGVAMECLMDLVKRNILLITKRRSNGQPKFCILHDLLRDFCRERAFHENFFHSKYDDHYSYPKTNEEVRHLNWYHSALYRSSHKQKFGKLVRSIHLFGESRRSDSSILFECANFKLLRVFDEFGRSDSSLASIPDVLFQMSNLKYLGFGPLSYLQCFPSTFMLQNLQSLIIQYVDFKDIELPRQIWQMTQLRHLIVPQMILPSIPLTSNKLIQKFECLQTLMTARNFRLTNKAIQMIPNIKKLKIDYDGRSSNKGGWKLHGLNNLSNLSRLEELKIRIEGYSTEDLSNKFAFPLNLKKLSLQLCRLPWRDLTLVGSLPHLQVLRLEEESFVGEEWEPKDGEFLSLKFLLLEELDLKYWRAEETHFPCLQHLEIKFCDDLEMIPLEIGDIPTLKVITVFERGDMVGESAIRIRDEQRNQGNDVLHLDIINKYGVVQTP